MAARLTLHPFPPPPPIFPWIIKTLASLPEILTAHRRFTNPPTISALSYNGTFDAARFPLFAIKYLHPWGFTALHPRTDVYFHDDSNPTPVKHSNDLFARSKEWTVNKPYVLVTGGVHGYETSGVQGALLFAQTKMELYTAKFNLLVLPCVSPWGYETIQVC